MGRNGLWAHRIRWKALRFRPLRVAVPLQSSAGGQCTPPATSFSNPSCSCGEISKSEDKHFLKTAWQMPGEIPPRYKRGEGQFKKLSSKLGQHIS